jgi:hypothetical protein
MMNILFYTPLFSYEVKDWDRKKKDLLSLMGDEFDYVSDNFQTDRHCKKQSYSMEFMRLFSDEFGNFLKETKVNDFRVSDVWTVKYSKGNENHCPHNHKSTGYSGLLYLEFDPEIHQSVKFIGPWNDPINDTSQLTSLPNPKTGVIYIWESILVHYVDPIQTNKLRMSTSFDIEVVK